MTDVNSESMKMESSGNTQEKRAPGFHEGDGIDLGEYIAILYRSWWKIFLISLAVGTVTLAVMFRLPNIYQATAVISPPFEEKRQNPAFGVLASFGIDIGNPAKVEDLDTLFKSQDLTVRVFRKHNLWPILLGDRYDPATGKMKISWVDRLLGREKEAKAPTDWDAIRAAKSSLRVSVNKRAETVVVSFESVSAEGSAEIVKYYLDEGKSRLQEEALDRAVRNKKFIEEQIGRTVDALTRDRLYSLYGQEVEREMMARNREQFGFRVIDAPRVPDKKSSPRRMLAAFMAALFSAFVFYSYYVVKDRRRMMGEYSVTDQ